MGAQPRNQSLPPPGAINFVKNFLHPIFNTVRLSPDEDLRYDFGRDVFSKRSNHRIRNSVGLHKAACCGQRRVASEQHHRLLV